jgi:peptide/nickel transport system substrate-binding protein
MNGRTGVWGFFVVVALVVLILLQAVSIVQSDKFYRALNRLDNILSGETVSGGIATGRGKFSTQADEDSNDAGDWLVWGLTDEPGTINPVTRRDIYAEWIIYRNVVEGLLDYDYDEVQLKPHLAEDYSVSEDGLEITYTIRDDVWFSDGMPITADDVIFTYETIINPGVDAPHLANYYRDVKEVVKIDDRTVKFVLKEPYFKALEFTSLGSSGVLPKHVYEFTDPMEFNKRRSAPVGSGPYIFEKWDVGEQIVLTRNENYWGEKPKLKKIVFRFITNEVAALQALEAETIDFLEPSPEQFADKLADEVFQERFRCLSYFTPTVPYFYIGWNNEFHLFEDRQVRLAMTHLIDRERIIKYLLKGQAELTTGPFYINGPQTNPDIEPWPYDPEKAKKLLEEAGWVDTDGDGIRDKDGVPFSFKLMIRSGDPYYERLAKFIRDEAENIGIEVVPDPYEWSIFLERIMDRKFEAQISGWGGVVEEDPYQVWHSSQADADRGSNHIAFKNAEADEIIMEARRTLDREKRNGLYHRFHRILHERQPCTFLYTRPEMRFLHPRFENVKVHNLGLDWLEWYVPKDKQKYR